MMPEYLKYVFTDSLEFVNTFDELPLWSASFGLLLLKHLELKPGITMIDIGCGAGFPLLELAMRLGDSSTCYGVDPWTNATQRAKQKIKNYGITNTEILEMSAEKLPFADATIDLIVSNLGINNLEQPGKVFAECSRVMKPGARLALTTNLDGHWQEFYDIFEETLRELGKIEQIPGLVRQQEHRGSIESISRLYTGNGMEVSRHFEEQFTMTFVNGSALLNHNFVKLGWLTSWKDLIPETEQEAIFSQLERNLNAYATRAGSLTLTVPMAYMEGVKI